jgi:hypothetical protein
MTTKPKTRKASAAGTGVTPKMMELAAKIDKEHGSTTTFFSRSAPNTGKAPTANGADPVFALIDAHKARTKEWRRLYSKLDKAELQARETHGPRPWELIAWRNYAAIGGQEIDDRRKEFLNQPGADRKQVEKEFRDAKAREGAAEQAGVEWDHRAGIAPLREQYEHANAAERRAAMRMARTKPTTPAGAAALVAYTRRDLMCAPDPAWPMVALKTVASALTRMVPA